MSKWISTKLQKRTWKLLIAKKAVRKKIRRKNLKIHLKLTTRERNEAYKIYHEFATLRKTNLFIEIN